MSCAKSQYSLEKHLAMAIFMGRWREGLMAMFTVYFDASGSPDDLQTAALVVAGSLTTAEQWIEFERNWNSVLREFGVSSLHMKYFAHSAGEYSSWKGDERKRRRFLSKLINVVTTRIQHTFASSILMADYRSVDEEYRLHEEIKPYAIAGVTCVAKTREWAKERGVNQEQIAYFFEDGDKDKGNLIQHMKLAHGFEPFFLPKEKSVAFQAADLLAYEHLLANTKIFKFGPGSVSFRDLRHPIKELDKIPHGKNGEHWGVHQAHRLRDSCEKTGIPKRVRTT